MMSPLMIVLIFTETNSQPLAYQLFHPTRKPPKCGLLNLANIFKYELVKQNHIVVSALYIYIQ